MTNDNSILTPWAALSKRLWSLAALLMLLGVVSAAHAQTVISSTIAQVLNTGFVDSIAVQADGKVII